MKKFQQEHKILFASIIFSLLLAIVCSTLIIIMFLDDTAMFYDVLFVILIHLLLVLPLVLISFIGTKTFIRHPKATKIITGILTTLALLLQILIYINVFCISYVFRGENYNKPRNYKKALNTINSPTRIKHFPRKIPKNAKNVKMEKFENNFKVYSEIILLKFDINKKYIEDELKKYNFNYIEKVDQANRHPLIRYILSKAGIPNEQEKDFTFYIIHDKKSELSPYDNSLKYHYGIITNDKLTTIIYYYFQPGYDFYGAEYW